MKTFGFLKMSVKTLILAGTLTSLVACSGGGGGGREGTSSGGGGGYGDESSNFLLNLAGNELVQRLKNASPEIYANLPKNFVPDLIKLVDPKNIKVEQEKSVYRDGTELMFNYVEPKNGKPYVEALKLYYKSHASVAVNYIEPGSLHQMKKEIQMRLLHEASHILGIGRSKGTDKNSRKFAKDLLYAFDEDLLFCIIPSADSDPNKLRLFTMNRNYGFGDISSGPLGVIHYVNNLPQPENPVDIARSEDIRRNVDPTDFGYGPESWSRAVKRPLKLETNMDMDTFRFNTVHVEENKTIISYSGPVNVKDYVIPANPEGQLKEQIVIEGLSKDAGAPAELVSELIVDGKSMRESYKMSCRSYYKVMPLDSTTLEFNVEKP